MLEISQKINMSLIMVLILRATYWRNRSLSGAVACEECSPCGLWRVLTSGRSKVRTLTRITVCVHLGRPFGGTAMRRLSIGRPTHCIGGPYLFAKARSPVRQARLWRDDDRLAWSGVVIGRPSNVVGLLHFPFVRFVSSLVLFVNSISFSFFLFLL